MPNRSTRTPARPRGRKACPSRPKGPPSQRECRFLDTVEDRSPSPGRFGTKPRARIDGRDQREPSSNPGDISRETRFVEHKAKAAEQHPRQADRRRSHFAKAN